MNCIAISVILLCVSSLTGAAEQLRDPFLPVGFKPTAKGAAPNTPKDTLNFDNLTPEEQSLIRAHMSVSGILRQAGSFTAFINGVVVKDGDTFPLNIKGQQYKFRIKEISENKINLEPVRDISINGEKETKLGDK